jgi:F-type H+-transporting ATPase subunit b
VYLLLAAETATTATEASGLSINLFWVIVAALNFIIFLVLIWQMGFGPISRMLAERKARIDQGLADAEEAQRDRAAGAAERDRILADTRREASVLLLAAQKSAEELRAADIAATKADLERLREQAAADTAAERDRALSDLRAQVADLALAAAGKVVSETMTDARQRRLVDEFLRENGTVEGKAN